MAMKRVHVVNLSEQERVELIQYLRKGKSSARSQTRARILLLSDDDLEDDEIVETLKVSKSTVCRIRKRYFERGLGYALQEKPRSGAPKKIDGKIEAKITMLACSEPPEGRSKWSLKLLADKLVEMEVVDSISNMSVQRVLKKMKLNLG
jgi:putative transposase